MRTLFGALASVLMSLSICSPALAMKGPSNLELLQAITDLKARVETLEAEVRSLKGGETTTQEAQIPQAQLTALREEPATPLPLRLAPSASQDQSNALPAEPSWSGLYWGASFGLGASRARSKYTTTQHDHNENLSSDSSASGFSQSLSINDSMYLTKGNSGTDEDVGALSDLFLGANVHLLPRLVAGVQVEGSLAALNFDSKVRQRTSSVSTFSTTSSSANTFAGGSNTSNNASVSNISSVSTSEPCIRLRQC